MDEDGQNWLARVVEGGLPKVLLGPAGAAISRLVGATVEIPASWLEGIAQTHRDRTAARSAVSSALAQSAANAAALDHELSERALNSLLAREYREQRNKDAVAKVAVEAMIDQPPPDDCQAPSDQFMTRFERFASEAENTELREMFGRLLAGEIREQGSVAAQTLHFVSMLEGESARLIERVLPFCGQGLAFLDAINPKLSVVEITALEQIGFWTAEKNLTVSADQKGSGGLSVTEEKNAVLFFGSAENVNFDVALLSKAGQDLHRVIDIEFDIQALTDACGLKEVTSLAYGRFESVGEGFRLLEPEFFYPPNKKTDS